ncbi:MAG: tetratricopeptide repeat protein, partial [Legionella sp.]|nr:tetratricopeptide repeat protein [Legionella sp.]
RALMYQKGLGGKVDYPKAIALYEKAIEKGEALAMNNRAFMYQNGLGGEVDYPKAIALYEKAIEKGNALAMNNRAFMYQNGLGGEVDYSKAIALYEKAIEKGDALAMNYRAVMYEKGLGGEVDYPKAIALYEKAIEKGNALAMNNRAAMYEKGLGGEVDYPKAIALYEKAIEKGNASAVYCRASMYKNGLGGEVDYFEAIKLLIKSLSLKFDRDSRFLLLTRIFFCMNEDEKESTADALLIEVWSDLLQNRPFCREVLDFFKNAIYRYLTWENLDTKQIEYKSLARQECNLLKRLDLPAPPLFNLKNECAFFIANQNSKDNTVKFNTNKLDGDSKELVWQYQHGHLFPAL